MAADQMLGFLAGLVIGAAVAAGIAWLLQARRLKREHERMHRFEQAYQLSQQQVTQARKQVEQLQRECHELKLALRPHHTPHHAAPSAGAPAEPVVDAAEATRRYAESLLHPKPAKQDEPEAFPDTQVLRRPAPN